jgi:hypothetical protein
MKEIYIHVQRKEITETKHEVNKGNKYLRRDYAYLQTTKT